MYCKNCGKQIDDDSKFCSFCGADISSSTSSNSNNIVNEDNPSVMNARFNYGYTSNLNNNNIKSKNKYSPLYIATYVFNVFIVLTLILVFMAAPFISIFFADKSSSAKTIVVSIGLTLIIVDGLLNAAVATLLVIKNKKFFVNAMSFRVVLEILYIITIVLYILVLNSKNNSIINILGPVSGLITSSLSMGLLGLNRQILIFSKYINK